MFPQLENINLDIFRKILDGTVYIPGREEVIERTKAVIVHDVNSGSNMQKQKKSVSVLYEGLYRMDDDGNNQSEQDYNKNLLRRNRVLPYHPHCVWLERCHSHYILRTSEHVRICKPLGRQG